MKYYHNNESDIIESLDDIRSDYELFGDEYDTFDDFLNACMASNNGVLTPVSVRLTTVKRRLNEKLVLAQKYGYDEYADELADLLEEMDTLSKYARAERA